MRGNEFMTLCHLCTHSFLSFSFCNPFSLFNFFLNCILILFNTRSAIVNVYWKNYGMKWLRLGRQRRRLVGKSKER